LNRAIPTCALVLATTLSVYGSLAYAGQNIYRWVDARGNQVNSDRPPPQGIKYEVISTQSSLVRPVDADEGAVPAKVEPTPDNEFEPVDTAKPKVLKNPEYCKRAQENLATLDTHAQIRMRDEKGEVRYLSDDEVQVERNKALETIKLNCD
jgi:hypothetical protein